MATWQILERYPPVTTSSGVFRFVAFSSQNSNTAQLRMATIRTLSGLARRPVDPDLLGRITSASLAERQTIINGLPPASRVQVLAGLGPMLLQGLPDLQAEANAARGGATGVTAALNMQSVEVSADQLRIAQQGTEEERLALLNGMDPERQRQFLSMFSEQNVPPAYRRMYLETNQPSLQPLYELTEAKLHRAVYSPRQLEEVLVDFWLNHFNVYSGKGAVRAYLSSYERDVIRPHVLGRFRDMLLASARHPAMLFYLDNWESRAPGNDSEAAGAPSRRRGLNENYGRELLELHTLGVDGGYTQGDVIAVARAFTGWTIYQPYWHAEFEFDPAMHDRGEKVVLGHTLAAGGGEQDGLTIIDLLARHPSTARFISRKLAQRFVADDPPQALVDRMAAVFRRTDGDLRAVMETMLLSREFLSEGAWHAKVKSPLEMVVSALRALNADVTDTAVIAQRIAELGQPLYGKPEPTGYPNTGEVWSSAAGLLGRIHFANALAEGRIAGVSVATRGLEPGNARETLAKLLGVEPSAATVAQIERGAAKGELGAQAIAAIGLASPDFQRK
jgi:uncharacterized protein (DUF1800 family)